jgi:hypothetical protein
MIADKATPQVKKIRKKSGKMVFLCAAQIFSDAKTMVYKVKKSQKSRFLLLFSLDIKS